MPSKEFANFGYESILNLLMQCRAHLAQGLWVGDEDKGYVPLRTSSARPAGGVNLPSAAGTPAPAVDPRRSLQQLTRCDAPDIEVGDHV
jgi:hypothetical protein